MVTVTLGFSCLTMQLKQPHMHTPDAVSDLIFYKMRANSSAYLIVHSY